MKNIYSKRGDERRAMATDKHPDYYGIRLVRYHGSPAFMSSRREFYQFSTEKDRIPAYLSARAGAAWPRPDWLDEVDGEFIDTRNGKRFPFKEDPLHRRFILDAIMWGEAHRQAEQCTGDSAVIIEQPGEEKENENESLHP